MTDQSRHPGWDAQAVSDIVARYYGGHLSELFEVHGWPERGAAMLPAQGKRIASIYGNIQAFVDAHANGRDGNPVLNPLAVLESPRPQVLLTAYWGFTPEDWPCLTFTDASRLQTVLAESSPGFLSVIYANNTSEVPAEIRGRVIGIYQLSHQIGETEQFLSPAAIERKRRVQRNPNAWNHAFRALRAWQVAPDAAPLVSEFADVSYSPNRGMTISRRGTWLEPSEARKILDLDLISRPLFGSELVSEHVLDVGRAALKPSRPGPVSQSAYVVQEAEGPKYLYVLHLDGNADHFLGAPSEGKKIIKVGFSKSPATRCTDHNRALPDGAFKWQIARSTKMEGRDPYASSAHAKAGEQEMMRKLEIAGRPLGGEFFLADDQAIEAAWAAGKHIAENWKP